MNYYPHHIGDYRRDTAHLSLLEHGVYRQLLDTYYLSEHPIPRETEVVFRRLSARTEEEKKAVEIILSEFFVLTEDGWVQSRCDEEIREFQGKANRARDNGKLGGRPKKTKEVISGLSELTEEKANHKPLTINQEPKVKTLRPVVAEIFPHIQDRQLVNDWMSVRKTKKAAITQTALDGFMNEVEKSGLSLEDVLRRCCEHNWAGFKASWIQKQEKKTLDEITPELFDWAVEQGIPEARVKPLTDKFILNHRSKGHDFVDWEAAWKMWIIDSVSYAEQRR